MVLVVSVVIALLILAGMFVAEFIIGLHRPAKRRAVRLNGEISNIGPARRVPDHQSI